MELQVGSKEPCSSVNKRYKRYIHNPRYTDTQINNINIIIAIHFQFKGMLKRSRILYIYNIYICICTVRYLQQEH